MVTLGMIVQTLVAEEEEAAVAQFSWRPIR
jgi:hypothetical protein